MSFALPSSDQGETEQANILQSQADFLGSIATAQREIVGSSNPLAASKTLLSRDIDLSRYDNVTGWRGHVTGVQEMQGKGAIGVDLGGVELVAGQYLFLGLDTLVPPSQQRLYEKLLSLRSGEEVILSGSFVIHEGALVELSYTKSGSTESPRFLFYFDDISPSPR